MRFITLRYLGALFYVVLLVTAGLAHAQSSETGNVEANQLFVEAVMLYRHAIALPEEDASERLIQVRRLFDRILANHPDSLPGQAIRAGGSLGGVDLAALPPSLPTGWNDGKRAIARDLLNAYGGKLAELERVADYADYAALASAVYGGEDVIELARQRGWREHPRSRDGHFVVPRVGGFGDAAARLFISDQGEAVLSFRGTDTEADWLTNIGTVQPVFWDQLRSARVLADRVLAIHPDVSFVGHSLGGAMAQMARLHTGQAAVIFNSAPLGYHALRMVISGELLNSQVRSALLAFRSPEDPLREVTESISGFEDAVVRNIALTDNTVFRNVLDGLFGTNHAHTMPVLAQAMQDARFARDEGWLYAYLLEQSGIGVFAEPIQSDTEATTVSIRFAKEGCIPRMVGACSICDPVELGLFKLGRLTPSKTDSELNLKWFGQCNHQVDLFAGGRGEHTLDMILNLLKTSHLELLSVSETVSEHSPDSAVYEFQVSNLQQWDQLEQFKQSLEKDLGFQFGSYTPVQAGKTLITVVVRNFRGGAVDGFGLLKAYEGEIDYFSISASEENGLVFRNGMPEFLMPSNYIEFRTVTRTKVQEKHECPDRNFMNFYIIVRDGLPLHIDPIANAIIQSANDQFLQQCPGSKDAQYDGYLVMRSAVEQAGGFENFFASTRNGGPQSEYIQCQGHFSKQEVCSSRRWNSIQNRHIGSMKKAHDDRVARAKQAVYKHEQEARAQARAAEKDRLGKLRLAAEEQWKERWRLQLDGEDPLENITDLMRFDRATTIAELSKGRHMIMTYRSRNVEFAQGKAMLSDYQRGTDIYEGIPVGGFSWEGWFDAMSAAQKWSFTVVCRLDADALVGMSEGAQYIFHGLLHSVTDSNYTSQVVLDCARTE